MDRVILESVILFLHAMLYCKENNLGCCQMSLHKLNQTWQLHLLYFNQHSPKTPKPLRIGCSVCIYCTCQSLLEHLHIPICVLVFFMMYHVLEMKWLWHHSPPFHNRPEEHCDSGITAHLTDPSTSVTFYYNTSLRPAPWLLPQTQLQWYDDYFWGHNGMCSIFNKLCRLWAPQLRDHTGCKWHIKYRAGSSVKLTPPEFTALRARRVLFCLAVHSSNTYKHVLPN